MKRIVLLLSLTALVFVACEGPMGPPGDGVNWIILNYTIDDIKWKLERRPGELGSYYWVELPVRELTKFVCEEGNVFGYRKLGNEMQTPLGQVVVMGESDNHGNVFLFTEVYSFSFRPGYVTFYVDYSDFATDVSHPGTCEFRIVLNY